MLLIGLLAAVAAPFLVEARDGVDEVRGRAEARNVQMAADAGELIVGQSTEEGLVAVEPTVVGDVAVAGARLERSADGATCLWTESANSVFGIWERQGETLYVRLDAKPEGCPTRAVAVAMGFAASP